MSVLCVAAHPDDEVLGPGGTLARHAAAGEDVHVCFLSDGVTSRHQETDSESEAVQTEIERRRRRARRACETLGATASFHTFPDNRFDEVALLDIVQTVETEIEKQEPSVVYTHHYGDLNIDHERTCRATVTATRPLPESEVDRVLAFETLSASEWSVPNLSNTFQPTTFVDIEGMLDRKVDALKIYEDELRDPPHPRNEEIVRRNVRVWGAKAGVDAAEPFVLLREVHRDEPVDDIQHGAWT